MTAAAGERTRTSPMAHALDRRVTILSLGAVAAIVGWAWFDRAGLESVSPIVAAVGIIVGVPHGAMDHLVPGLASRRWQEPRRLALVVAVHVVIAAAASLATLRAPDLSFATFLVVSALHFGWAETTFAAERSGRAVPRLRDGWWSTLAHGSVVVVLPLWSAEGRSAMQPLLPGLVDWVSAVPTQWATTTVVLMCAASAVHPLRGDGCSRRPSCLPCWRCSSSCRYSRPSACTSVSGTPCGTPPGSWLLSLPVNQFDCS